MFLELPRHDDLTWRCDLGELAAAAVGVTVCKANSDAPLAADAEVRVPLGHAVKLGMSPPAFDLVRGEGAEDALGRHSNFCGGDDRASPAVGHGARGTPLRTCRQSEISFHFRFSCHLTSSR